MQKDPFISPLRSFFHNKWVLLFLLFDIILLLIPLFILLWQNTAVSTINLNFAPIDSTITVNGNSDFTNGEYSITPGTYKIAVSHEGLEPKSFTINIPPNYSVTVSAFLSESDHSFNFYKLRDNFRSYRKLAEIASSEHNTTFDHDTSAEEFVQRFQKNYDAFTTELPIEYRESEGYGRDLSILKNITIKADSNCSFTLCVQALVVGTDSKEFIDKLLEEKGFNVEDLQIDYKFY